MRKYLDPVYLALSEEAWNTRIYAEIFDSLNTLLTRIEEVEKSTGTLYQLVKFRLTEAFFALVYSNNPFKNEPEIQEFYTKLFKDKILPELLRRTEWCPSFCTLLMENTQGCQFTNSLVPEDVLTEWNTLIGQCLSCDAQELLCLMSPLSYPTEIITTETSSINNKLCVTNDVEMLFDLADFVSAKMLTDANREECLKHAITIFYHHQSVIQGGWTPNLNPQNYEFDEHFWQTIDRSDLLKEDREYRERFINSMTQIVYNLDLGIRKHDYQGEKITVDGKKYKKSSADVFQMGRGTKDRRCSRIFYCKIKDKIHFYEFEPDHHAGE
jgi:hypothetical protein